MRSTNFGSIVSPLGSPALSGSRHAPSRPPSGGLSALKARTTGPKVAMPKPIPMTKVTTSLPTLHHPKLNTMSGVSGRGMPNMKLASGAPKKSGGIALPKLTPSLKTGKTQGYAKGGSVAQKLSSAKAKLGPAKKTVDMVEGDKVVVRHTFYGKDKKEAAHMQRSHEKADRSFRAAEQGKPYKGIDIKALVRKARGGGVFPRRFGDGGTVPTYDEYLASSAAPKGLSPDEYQQDYENYKNDLYNANRRAGYSEPYGAVRQATGSKDEADFASGLGKLKDGTPITPDMVRDWKDSQTRSLGAQAWAGAPWLVPAFGTGLAAGDALNWVGHATGLMKPDDLEFPGFEHYLGAYQSATGDDPRALRAAKAADEAFTVANIGNISKSLYGGGKWLYTKGGPKLRAFIQQQMARARDAKINKEGQNLFGVE